MVVRLRPKAWCLVLLGIAWPLLASSPPAVWIAPPAQEACPVNALTYLRKVVRLEDLHGDLSLQMAADSNARMWINGHIVRRKVTRFFEPAIATETIDARPWLHRGANVVVLLHHSWGPITTFQRDGCSHAGVYLTSRWLVSDASWKAHRADEFAANEDQITGLPPGHGAHRIRFAQFIDGDKLPPAAMFTAGYHDVEWSQVQIVVGGPWPANPLPTGTPGQREVPVRPVLLLAEGHSEQEHVSGVHPVAIERSILTAALTPSGPQAVAMPHTIEVDGEAGETRYVTFDFGRPVHGYPFLTGRAAGGAPVIDLAYGELVRSPLTGEALLKQDGWLNPEAIVGQGYIDRYTAVGGQQHVEFSDERTARWWTLHLFFPAKGRYRIEDAGFVSSQYPVTLRGSFHGSDPRLQQVVSLSLEHAIVSMSDTYVDTPGREDGQWLEDARLRAELAAEWFGDVRLRQLFLKLVAESQHTDGTFHPFPPSNYPIVSNADWAMEWVGALYDDSLWTGETKRVREYWPQVEAFWRRVLADVSATGLWINADVFADIRVGVHPSQGQSSGIVTAQLIDRLELSVTMAKALGQERDADAWGAMHSRLLQSFLRDHLVPQAGTVPLHVDDVAEPGNLQVNRGYSQAAQAMAISAGLLPETQARADLNYAFADPDGSPLPRVDRWNNPTYLFRSLDAMSSAHLSSRALAHLLERFSAYLPGDPHNVTAAVLQGRNGGPLPEYWISRADLDLAPGVPASTQPIDATGSHGWNAVGLVWLHRRMLGVTIAAPGGKTLRIQPDAAGLAHIDGTTMTPHGAVTVAWSPGVPLLQVDLPPRVTALVLLPAELVELEQQNRLKIPPGCSLEARGNLTCMGRRLVFESKRRASAVTASRRAEGHFQSRKGSASAALTPP